MKCQYGCGKEAKHQFKNGKWCCENSTKKCPEIIMKSSKTRTGVKRNIEQIKNISNGHIGQKSTKKDLTYKEIYGERSDIIKEKMRNKKLLVKNLNKIKFKFPLLVKIEKLKIINDIVHVKCKNNSCEKWFIPLYSQIYERHRALNTPRGYEENNFYCSDECKNTCVLYGSTLKSLENFYTYSEYQTFRQQILKRENYLCEYCEDSATVVHHIKPQKLEPFFILDPDFGVACCRKCHYQYGHKTGTECSTGNLPKIVC